MLLDRLFLDNRFEGPVLRHCRIWESFKRVWKKKVDFWLDYRILLCFVW